MSNPRIWRLPSLGSRAVAAVEFAICAPMLLILLMGTAEMLTLYRTASKLNELTSNFAEMVTLQVNSPVAASGAPGLTDLCTGAVYGLIPFPPLGLSIAVASVTYTPAGTSKYGEWEVDLTSNCATSPTQTIGPTGAMTIASPILQGAGDNVIVVQARLSYPGVLGLFINSALSLSQTAIARWRYASATKVNMTSTNLEFLCTGTNCQTHTCNSTTSCS